MQDTNGTSPRLAVEATKNHHRLAVWLAGCSVWWHFFGVLPKIGRFPHLFSFDGVLSALLRGQARQLLPALCKPPDSPVVFAAADFAGVLALPPLRPISAAALLSWSFILFPFVW